MSPFGATVSHREHIDLDGVEEALIVVADSYIQLLTPTSDSSPVAKYLAGKGEGIHHVGYRVDDCGAALATEGKVAGARRIAYYTGSEQGEIEEVAAVDGKVANSLGTHEHPRD